MPPSFANRRDFQFKSLTSILMRGTNIRSPLLWTRVQCCYDLTKNARHQCPAVFAQVIERAFASSIVLRLVENPIEMPRFATSGG
jgi:hypothetical protein